LSIANLQDRAQAIVTEVERSIVGKTETVRRAVLCLLCNGHLLLEDIPGVGKTTLAKALAHSIGGDFRRIQFTPDLLPADVTGTSIFNQRDSDFEFRPGPVFGNVILADEINRATPKTQSALLEAMEERQVTTDGQTRTLPDPFFVIATQNAIEMTGTYPLPEAQLDRFFARLSLGYPDRASEAAVLTSHQLDDPILHAHAVTSPEELREMQDEIRRVFVHDVVKEYIVDVVRSTRESNQLLMGASPRGSLHLMRAAQAHAAMAGEEFVRPDDVKALASAVLAHRVIPRAELRAKGQTTESLIERLVETVPVPAVK
jgi:MoxR-like ATPase